MPAFENFSDLKKFIYNAGYETTVEYLKGEQVLADKMDIRLVIYPVMVPYVPVELIGSNLSNHVSSVTFKKDRHTAGGSFVVTLSGDDNIYREVFSKYLDVYPIRNILELIGINLNLVFKPPSMAMVWVNGYHKMTGILKSFRKDTSADGEKIYVAEFDELGNVLTNEILDTVTYVDTSGVRKEASSLTQFTDKNGIQVGLAIHTVIEKFIKAFIQDHLGYAYGTRAFSTSDGNLLDYRFVSAIAPFGAISNETYISTFTAMFSMITHGGNSFWDFLKSQLPNPFVEFWCESGGRTRCVKKPPYMNAALSAAITAIAANDAKRTTNLSDTITLNEVASVASQTLGGSVAIELPGRVYPVFRSSPYNNFIIGKTAYDLSLNTYGLSIEDLLLAGDFVIITDDDIISKSIGTSDTQQNTVWRLNFNGGGTAGGQNSLFASFDWGPLVPIFPGGIQSFGFKQSITSMTMTSNSWRESSDALKEQDSVVFRAIAYTDLLKIWFRNQSKFLEGTFTTRPKPYGRPGDLLLYLPRAKDGRIEDGYQVGVYYIDDVQESYGIDSENTTTFSVIRGTPLPYNMSQLALLLIDWNVISDYYPNTADLAPIGSLATENITL